MEPPSAAWFLSSLLIPVLVILILILMNDSRKNARGHNLPPGTSGLPFIGETIQFARLLHPSTSVRTFVEERVQKYGNIFRTHLMGNPTVMSTDLEFIQFVMKNDGVLFENDLPRGVKLLFGADVVEQQRNRYLRTASHEFLAIPHVRSRLLADFEHITVDTLRSWKEGVEFPVLEETAKVSFYLMMKSIFNLNPEEEATKDLFRLYRVFSKGVRHIPLNFPGTIFRKSMKAKEAIVEILQTMKEVRLNMGKNESVELIDQNLDYFNKLLKTPSLNMEQLIHHILGLIYAGHETISTALGLAIYFVGTCPKAIKQLQEEHAKIISNNKMRGDTNLTWRDIMEMEFTKQVIKETLRLGNVANILYRKASKDINLKGYDIPNGWSVLAVFAAAHLNTSVYKEPERFDPWRWQDNGKRDEMMESYMPFSKGFHKCAGNELAMMEMSVFLHHFVTMYDWELSDTDPPQITYDVCGFVNGLPIKVYSKRGPF